MVRSIINIGSRANSGDGDDLRSALEKINNNFSEIYGYLGSTGFLPIAEAPKACSSKPSLSKILDSLRANILLASPGTCNTNAETLPTY